MGLFSRKQDDEGFATTANDSAVVRVIRSRFYGKSKGKERESSKFSYTPSDASPSQTLSSPGLHPYAPSSPSPLAKGRSSIQGNAAAGPSSPRVIHQSDPATPPSRNAKRPHPGSPDMPPPPPPKSPTNGHRQRDRETNMDSTPSKSSMLPTSSPRKTVDSVTVTLAQKLNELAAANSEGLLNDEEYRLLRQNLFERFSSTTAVPTETPVVPVSKPKIFNDDSSSSVSNSHLTTIPRSPSRTSLSSGVASIFRRATSRRPVSKDTNDTSSIVSDKSSPSGIFRTLARKSSISSVMTSTSQTQTDNMSITSRWTNAGSDRLRSESVLSLSPVGTKSTAGSVRRFNTPPSSFRGVGLDNKSIYSGAYDDDRLHTSQEIKDEITTIEAEARSMMDAFNGLELTALTKLQKKTGRNSVVGPSPDGGNVESTWTLVPNGQSHLMSVDNDSSSIRSATSATSAARSAYSSHQVRPKKMQVSPGLLLHRRNSSSSFNSSRTGGTHLASNSNLSLPKSASVRMRVVPEDGEEREVVRVGKTEEEEVEEIRRRREEVMMRYEARLEYLRARLKGAHLHEKLIRK